MGWNKTNEDLKNPVLEKNPGSSDSSETSAKASRSRPVILLSACFACQSYTPMLSLPAKTATGGFLARIFGTLQHAKSHHMFDRISLAGDFLGSALAAQFRQEIILLQG